MRGEAIERRLKHALADRLTEREFKDRLFWRLHACFNGVPGAP